MTKSQRLIQDLVDCVNQLETAIKASEMGVTGNEHIDGDIVRTQRAMAYEQVKTRILTLGDQYLSDLE